MASVIASAPVLGRVRIFRLTIALVSGWAILASRLGRAGTRRQAHRRRASGLAQRPRGDSHLSRRSGGWRQGQTEGRRQHRNERLA